MSVTIVKDDSGWGTTKCECPECGHVYEEDVKLNLAVEVTAEIQD